MMNVMMNHDEPFEAFELAVDLPIVTDICWGFG